MVYAVATQNVTVRYGEVTAVRDVSLRVPEGTVYVLIGANGAGKTTTLNVLLNLQRPSVGSATVFGRDVAAQGGRVRAQIGYVPEQRAHCYRSIRCDRLLQHVASYYPSWDHAYATRLITAFNLQLNRQFGTLSKGESRRLQLVLAMAHRPPLLLLDEPTDGLDPIVRRRVLTLLAQHLAESPTTVVLSTHHISDVEGLADHVGVLNDGRLVTQLSRDELTRIVQRYSIAAPPGWNVPAELQPSTVRRSHDGREIQCTLVGQEDGVAERLRATGARVLDVTTLPLEDAALAFLPEETL